MRCDLLRYAVTVCQIDHAVGSALRQSTLVLFGDVLILRSSPPEVFLFVIEGRLALELQDDAEVYSDAIRIVSDDGDMLTGGLVVRECDRYLRMPDRLLKIDAVLLRSHAVTDI